MKTRYTGAFLIALACTAGCVSQTSGDEPTSAWEFQEKAESTDEGDGWTPQMFDQPILEFEPGVLAWAPPDKSVVVHTWEDALEGRPTPWRTAKLRIEEFVEPPWPIGSVDGPAGRLVFVGVDFPFDERLHLFQIRQGQEYRTAFYEVDTGPWQLMFYFEETVRSEASEGEPSIAQPGLDWFRATASDEDRVDMYLWAPVYGVQRTTSMTTEPKPTRNVEAFGYAVWLEPDEESE